jgi:ABC-2 type transport system permease protein
VAFGGKATVKRAPFRLAAWLPVEAAFLWKNLMAAPRYINRKLFVALAVLAAAAPLWLQRHPEFDGPKLAAGWAFISLVLLIYLLLFGPHLARNDLRGDLLNADLLKTYPLPGWRIVLGGLLAPTVILTGIAWIFLIAATVGLVPPANKAGWLTSGVRLAAGGALAAVMPALCAVQLLVPNAATLIFPAWAQTGKATSGGGMDVMGQRLIFFVGQFICLALAVLPAIVAAGGTIFLTQWLIGSPAAILLAAVPVLGIFVGEICLGVWWIGPKFERLDISAELRP